MGRSGDWRERLLREVGESGPVGRVFGSCEGSGSGATRAEALAAAAMLARCAGSLSLPRVERDMHDLYSP